MATLAAALTIALSFLVLPACKDKPIHSRLDTVAYACLRAMACWIQPYVRVHGCLDNYRRRVVAYGTAAVMDDIYHCVNKASSCDEMEQCFGVGESCNSSFPARCDGNTAVYCDLIDGVTYSYDCGAFGLGCQVDPLITYAATCVAVRASTASATSILIGLNCDDGACERTGEACDTDELDRCEGARVRSCIDGEWVLFNCEVLGLRSCVMEDTGWAHCYRPE